MKKEIIALLMTFCLFSVIACSDCDCEKKNNNETINCNSNDCNKNIPEIKEEKSSWKEALAKGATVIGAAAAGAIVADKMHCDRLHLEIEYKLLDACLNSCSGIANRDARISKCAAAIQDMECKDGLKQGEILNQVHSRCPIQ